MSHYKGVLKEVLLEPYQNAAGILGLPNEDLPRPGQYLQVNSSDPLEATTRSLFPGGMPAFENGRAWLPISGPLEEGWTPGTELFIRGPFGNGFDLPKRAKHVALISIEDNPGKLIPLAQIALRQKAEVSLFLDNVPLNIPLGIEVRDLSEASNALAWADYLAITITADETERLSTIFGAALFPKRLTAEVLVVSLMPCGAVARCGVCAFETVRGTHFPCEDGPVFPAAQMFTELSAR